MVIYIDLPYLVGGLEHLYIFPYIGNVIIPIGELIYCQYGFILNYQPDL